MTIDREELTSLITRLEEEYGKATPKDWVAGEYENGGYWYGRIFFPGDPRNHLTNTRDCPMSKEDVAFIADAHNSMPTLLGALRHFMAVAEEERCKQMGGHSQGCPHDTPSLLNDKT